MFVDRAVERSHARVRDAATGLGLAFEEHGVDVLVLGVAPLEDTVPEGLGAVDVADAAAVLSRVDGLDIGALVGDLGGRVSLPDLMVVERAELAQPRVSAGEGRDQEVDDKGDEAETAASDRDSAGG